MKPAPQRRPQSEHQPPVHPTTVREDCAEIERCLLLLARFTGGHRQHGSTLRNAGKGHVESAKERRRRQELAQERRAEEPTVFSSDPARLATPVATHAAKRVNTALYPVLAVIEDLVEPHPVDIARVLTLDRSTVIRHLQVLEGRGLIYRDTGYLMPRRPRFRLTVDGFNAMVAIRRSRIDRLERALSDMPIRECRLAMRSLRRLAEVLHDEIEAEPLPGAMTDADERKRAARWYLIGRRLCPPPSPSPPSPRVSSRSR